LANALLAFSPTQIVAQGIGKSGLAIGFRQNVRLGFLHHVVIASFTGQVKR
jgi:hypothetical protein